MDSTGTIRPLCGNFTAGKQWPGDVVQHRLQSHRLAQAAVQNGQVDAGAGLVLQHVPPVLDVLDELLLVLPERGRLVRHILAQERVNRRHVLERFLVAAGGVRPTHPLGQPPRRLLDHRILVGDERRDHHPAQVESVRPVSSPLA